MALRAPVWRERGALGVVLAVFSGGLVLGGVASAAVVWTLAGLVGWVPAAIRATLLLAVAATVALHEFRIVRLPFLQNHRQVPQEIFTYGPYAAALQFGFELGTGVRTYLPSAVPYVLVAAVILLQVSLPVALLVGAAFGLGRAAMAFMRTASPDPAIWDAALRRRLRRIQPLTGLASVALCAVLVW